MFLAPRPSNVSGIRRLAQQVAFISWIVPLGLFIFVSGFETLEHLIIEGEAPNWSFSFEILFFGVVGPALVYYILIWIRTNLRQLADAYDEIQSLNIDLEGRIETRTAELAHANDELRQLDRLKSEFVALVSHELRAPLTNIQGGLELALNGLDPCAEVSRNALIVVRAEAERLTRLVQHILDVSALEAGRLQLNQGTVALPPLCRQVATRCVTPSEKHRLILQIPVGLQPVWADEDRLVDVLTNLMDNAVKYSPDGGDIRVQATGENGCVHLIVSDQGVGIPTSEQQRLFQPFYRSSKMQTRAIKGYGLGLYFCHKFIQAQGGRIWVESAGQAGQGASFHLMLPVDCGGEE